VQFDAVMSTGTPSQPCRRYEDEVEAWRSALERTEAGSTAAAPTIVGADGAVDAQYTEVEPTQIGKG
jgi:hypothetical protein